MTEHGISAFPSEVRKVLAIMEATGVAYDLVIFESPAHKATQAAELLRCPLGAIVKSLVFQGGITGKLVLIQRMLCLGLI